MAVTNALIAGYLAAAAAATLAGDALPVQRWLTLHLLFLGAATNAIVVYGSHFAESLLHLRPTSHRWADVRLALLNIAILAVFIGVATGAAPLTDAGVTLLVAVVAVHGGRLVRMARRSLAGKLRPAVWFYVASAASLAVGAVLGAILATGTTDAALHERLHATHAHLNLLGWVGLAVVGTLFMLWPAALRTRMVDDAPWVARRVLATCGTGLSVLAGGLLAGQPRVAAVGAAGYAGGVAWSLSPFVRTARAKPPKEAAPWWLAAATAWLTALTLADVASLATNSSDQVMDTYVPVFALGVVAQVLVGALTFLLPATLGGGPRGNKRMAATLSQSWIVRLIAANAGIVALACDPGGSLRTAAWASVLAGLGAFVPLAGWAIFRSLRPPADDSAAEPPGHLVLPAIAAVAALLVAVGTGVFPAGPTTTAVVPAGARTVTVQLSDFAMTPSVVTVPRGTQLALRVSNHGTMRHDLKLANGVHTRMLRPGDTETVVVGRVDRALEGWCTVPGHRQAGMTMTIRPGAAAARNDSSTTAHEARSAVLPPAGAATVHEVTLHARSVDVEVAPGVRQRMMTFDGTVPGPTLRGQVGDTFVVTLVNDDVMDHSIDLHASQVAPDVSMHPIPPGGSLVYRFIADHAGIWMYHCSTAPMALHIASGMYGAVVIDPPGLAPVDEEYALVQSGIYRGAGGDLPTLDQIRTGVPDYVVFNGYADQYGDAPLTANAGDRVRIWVLDEGPSGGSSFHVVGTQFDTVFKEGAYLVRRGNPEHGAAQVLGLSAAQGGFVEFTVPAAGRYPFLSHAMTDYLRGDAGTLVAR